MDPVFSLAIAVLLHVTWNLMARRYQPAQAFLWWVYAGQVVTGIPAVIWLTVHDGITTYVAQCLAIGIIAEMGYALSLGAAYRHLPASVVYPIARSSPILIAFIAWILFDEALGAAGWGGIVVTVTGFLLLAWSAWKDSARRALVFPVLTALSTSVYALTDQAAAKQLSGFVSVYGYATLMCLGGWPALALRQRIQEGHWVPAMRPPWFALGIASVAIGGAYALVIYATREIEAAVAVAIGSGGIVIVVLVGIFCFGERERTGLRLLAIAVIVAGLLLLVLR